MNKKLMVVAIASAMAMPLAANASVKNKVYGAVNISVDKMNESGANVNSDGIHASKIGMKGSMSTNIADFKVIYQIEAGMEIGAGKGFVKERDSWTGLTSKSMGTVRIGSMATHYKQTGKMTDVLFSTSAAGRGFIGTQSDKLHNGTGTGRGRATQMMRYDSPSISGAKLVAEYQLGSAGNNLGLGLQYKTRTYLAFFNYMDMKGQDAMTKDITAMKVGGKVKFGPGSIAAQYEFDDDGSVAGKAPNAKGDQLHVQGMYTMGATTLIATIGRNDENMGWAFAVSQKVAKKASIYAGYAASGADTTADTSAITVGMAVSFGK